MESQITLLKTFADQAVIAIENVRLFQELKESLEQQTATSEILGVIASSPTDIQPVLEAVVENAARLCDAKDASIFRVDGDMLDRAAAYGPMPGTDIRRSIGRGSVPGRAVIDKQTIHVRDILEAEAEKEFPDTGRRAQQFTGTRTILSTPLLREGVSIGTISVRRQEVRPFTDKQITLIEIFASQAVIAIENVRLFKELQERNRDLTEALEQQTATSEVLSVISSSPTDVQPVFDTIVKNATRLCEASFGSAHRFDNQLITLDAQYGMTTEQIELGQRQFPTPATRGKAVGRAILSREVIHIEDIGDDPEYEFVEVHTELSVRTVLAVPLIKDGTPIGALGMWRREVKPFTESQINLVKTFADQAVIAIENLRLFQELKESLEQQTATSEILGVIASSPTDIQPVLDVVAENAARLCDATDAVIHRIDGDNLRPVANYGPLPGRGDRESIPIDREHIPARAIIDRRTLHIDDLATVPMDDLAARFARSVGVRTVLATPLLREGIPIGSIHIRRLEVRAFTERQIKLLETFAAQAVIAIENVRLFQELKESLDQQTATSEILGVIASSPTDIQPVLDTVAATAARLCEAIDVMVLRVEGDVLRLVAHYGPIAAGDVALHRGTLGGRTVIERRLFHIRDLQAEVDEFPEGSALARERGHRTTLSVPLLRENVAIGNIQVRRDEVRPFSDQHISLLQTFADQAVIAIENVRLFKELETRNRQLTEALEQQTATSEVLRVIASSPTDLQPVLDAVAASAARLCDAIDARIMRIDGDQFHTAAHFGEMPEPGVEEPRFTISRDRPSGRAVIDRQTIHLHDLATAVEHEYPGVREYQRRFGARTVLVTPLMREGTPLGVIHIRRTEVRPFTDSQIKLLETFAAQAVIAIENVRLFNELDERNRQLTEALEQQTATSEVLRVIASSPTELQPVLDTLIANAVKLSGATQGHIRQYDGELLRPVAHYGESPEQVALLQETARKPTSEYTTGRAFLERKPVHVLDAQLEQPRPGIFVALRSWARTMLAVPLLREGTPIGVITIWRDFVEGFTERQIDLVQTFADQAVIAIENVRLFKELQERNRDLTEALEQQTATSEILRVIASSPTDLQPVFDAIVGSAARLCEATFAALHRFDGQMVKFDACYGMTEFEIEETRTRFPLPATREIAVGRAILDRRIAHIDDIRSDPEYRVTSGQMSFRTVLAVPLLREGNAVGALGLWRREVQPFTDKQMALVKTFADQAVIAIENVRLFQELKESLEQQTATSEILGVIASSPTDIQPVLDTVAENAARLCDADDAIIYRELGEHAQLAARYGSIPVTAESLPISRRFVGGRAMIDRQTIHVLDVVAEIDTEYPDAKSMNQVSGVRTVLATPLIRQGEPIGSIVIRRTEVRPFTEKQIKLLETFADQSVIAIENVRLFNELDTRNRQLTEALEQQTATSEILRVIASSPTDIQPVLDVVAENAASLCEATDVNIYRLEGSEYRIVAARGNMPIPRREEARPLIRGLPPGRAMIDREVIHIHDMSRPEAQAEYPEAWAMIKSFGFRTALAVPLLREGTAIGAILIRRNEVRPFSDKQIALLKTFADQAVIAIENVRLFQELQQRTRELVESVEEMKALSEVGQTVSSSLDLATVLETIVARAVDLVGTDSGVIYEFDEAGQEFHLRASHHMEAEAVEALRAARIRLGEGATGQAALTRAPVQIPDTFEEREGSISRVRPVLNRLGYRSLVTVPILREQQIMGGLTVWRRQAGEFEPEVVNLLQTFATQSALAIHNARLFREIEAKSAQLEVASRHKSEFLANMSHELRTPLNAIIGFSEVLLEKMFGELNDKQNEYVDDILSSGRHLLSLINDILDLSKIEAGRMDLEVTTFYLPDAIENALLLIRERANRHGIKLDRSIDERLGDFTGDERKVKQVLVNLLSNAVKFTPEGGQIKVEAGLGDHAAIISVTDTGIGIAKQDQEAIFEEFRQASGSYAHKREGTGLGLTLTRKFVEMHGGTIWVESDIGKGSTFTFTLPISLRSEG